MPKRSQVDRLEAALKDSGEILKYSKTKTPLLDQGIKRNDAIRKLKTILQPPKEDYN